MRAVQRVRVSERWPSPRCAANGRASQRTSTEHGRAEPSRTGDGSSARQSRAGNDRNQSSAEHAARAGRSARASRGTRRARQRRADSSRSAEHAAAK